MPKNQPIAEKKCGECHFWKPRYHGIGSCTQEGQPNAKFWINVPTSELLTVSSFTCQSFSPKQDPTKEMI